MWNPGRRKIPQNTPVQGAALEDRWIFSRFNACAEQVNRAIALYRYHEAAQSVWQFFWSEFCDWYIELKKLKFEDNSGRNDDWSNLLAVFEASLRLLHPVMPFLTEELWQRITVNTPGRPESISLAAFPQYRPDLADADAERDVEDLQFIITSVRDHRANFQISPRVPVLGSISMALPLPSPYSNRSRTRSQSWRTEPCRGWKMPPAECSFLPPARRKYPKLYGCAKRRSWTSSKRISPAWNGSSRTHNP